MGAAAKHTAGPVVSNGHTIRTADENNITRRRVATAHGPFGDAEKAANAELIAEAFNVAHETGLTPRQLAERCKELLEALRKIEAVWNATDLPNSGDAKLMYLDARAAIAKTEGGAS